jgi:hypothetical protein
MSNGASQPTLVVVIPYRDREFNRSVVVPVLHRHLAGVPHKIAVVEQLGAGPFNKGRLMNAGFDLHSQDDAYYCFHDVDMVPEGPECDYSFPRWPTLLATQCSQFGYALPYPGYFGGVTLFSKTHFVRVNGFSNGFWGWGSEDDDMANRVRARRYKIEHRPGRYLSLPHANAADSRAVARNLTLFRARRPFVADGLTTLAYRVERVSLESDHAHYLVDVGTESPAPSATPAPIRSGETS